MLGAGALWLTPLARRCAVEWNPAGGLGRLGWAAPMWWSADRWCCAGETFECACHGSYWDKDFKLLQGPAKSDLPPLQ